MFHQLRGSESVIFSPTSRLLSSLTPTTRKEGCSLCCTVERQQTPEGIVTHIQVKHPSRGFLVSLRVDTLILLSQRRFCFCRPGGYFLCLASTAVGGTLYRTFPYKYLFRRRPASSTGRSEGSGEQMHVVHEHYMGSVSQPCQVTT